MTKIEPNSTPTVDEIRHTLCRLGGYGGVQVPEFTFGSRRIDLAIIDTKKRWIRGFEIKCSRSDFARDDKWMFYSQFCSALSIACPQDLVRPEELGEGPFGLVYIVAPRFGPDWDLKWIKKPKRFQRRDALAWAWRYMEVLEAELPRIHHENVILKDRISLLEMSIENLREDIRKKQTE